jgi:multidrug resistance efflux pump
VALIRNSVQIIPSVAGEVIDVPVTANAPLKAGDVLFRIDPTTYKAQVGAIDAQLKFAQLRLSQMTELYQKDAGRGFDVQQRQADVDQLQASSMAPNGIWKRPPWLLPPMATSRISRCARARASPASRR